MATSRHDPYTTTARGRSAKAINTSKKSARSFKEFMTKFQNDWSLHLAQALAFSLMTALVPIAILLMGIVGAILGTLDPQAKLSFIEAFKKIAPPPISTTSSDVISTAINKLTSASGILVLLAILLAIFFGSRLFTLMEVCFDIIYRLRPRSFLRKNLVGIGMLILFVLLAPIMILAATGTDQFLSLVKSTPFGNIPSVVYRLGGIISSLILFEFFYVFIPNRHFNAQNIGSSIRNSWLGTLVAAIALQIYLAIFPIYISHYLNGYVGQIGFALMLLAFFYFFALILLLGAEVNAFFAERIGPPESDLITRASKGYYE